MEPFDGELVLTISDDGDGFSDNDGHSAGSFGLIGMEERARLIGAELRLDSTPGQGTRVEVRLPLGGAAAGAAV